MPLTPEKPLDAFFHDIGSGVAILGLLLLFIIIVLAFSSLTSRMNPGNRDDRKPPKRDT